MQAGVHVMPSFDDRVETSDVVALLQKVQHISNQTEANIYVYDAYLKAAENFFSYRQPDNMCITMYMKHFKYYMDCAEHVADGIFEALRLIQHEMSEDKKDGFGGDAYTEEEYRKRVRNKLMATTLIRKSNKCVYGPLVIDLHRERKDLCIDHLHTDILKTQQKSHKLVTQFSHGYFCR